MITCLGSRWLLLDACTVITCIACRAFPLRTGLVTIRLARRGSTSRLRGRQRREREKPRVILSPHDCQAGNVERPQAVTSVAYCSVHIILYLLLVIGVETGLVDGWPFTPPQPRFPVNLETIFANTLTSLRGVEACQRQQVSVVPVSTLQHVDEQ